MMEWPEESRQVTGHAMRHALMCSITSSGSITRGCGVESLDAIESFRS
jgi:hypothetical protein